MNFLIAIKKKIFCFASRMDRGVEQEMNEANESKTEMNSLIPNGTGLECIL